MKTLPVVVVCAAAIALGLVALRAPKRDYVPPTPLEMQAHVPAPRMLVGDVPAGCEVATFDVEGMCCTGCTGKLYAKLKAIPGFVAGAVDFEAGTAQAVVPKNTDTAALESALTFDKYHAKLR